KRYEVNGILYGAPTFVAGVQTPQAAWWMSFMPKYVTKTKGQAGDATNAGAELNSKTVMWCPAWDGYRRKSANPNETGGDVLRRQTGYSINYIPTYSASNPAAGTNYPNEQETIDIVLLDDKT